MSYKKNVVNKISNIRGNVKDYEQRIRSVYYKKTDDMPSKLAVYMEWYDNDGDQKKAIRSTYFSSVEQYKNFLKKMAYNLGFFMEKRGKFGEFHRKQVGKLGQDLKKQIKKGMKDAR